METEPIINQKEYLKKYLAIGKAPGEKKKKKKSRNAANRVTIIDDDAEEFTNTVIVKDPLIVDEDAPQIVAIIDERPPSMRIDEKTNNPLWQPIGSTETTNTSEQKQRITGFKIAPKSSDKTFARPDKSPPRSKKFDTISKRARDLEYSPPRRKASPPRNKRDDDSPPRIKIEVDDISPPRRSGDGGSPPRKSRSHDISPPRKRRISDDISPPRKRRTDDISPPRKSRSDDISPPRKRRNGSSPPRKSRSGDISPPRKHRNDSLAPRKSPPRKHRSGDISPPRKKRQTNDSPPPRKHDKDKTKEEKSSRKMETTLDGKRAGLQDARELADETVQFRNREDQLFKNLSKEVSGENAETVFRDRRSGKIRNLEEEEERQRKKREEEEKNKEKYMRWGRGLVQVESRDQKIQDELYEMSKPLARYADDADLEKYLKDQEREGDPMLAYIRSKKRKNAAKEGKVEKPQFEGQFMPNRFGIKPGHRWDGVDRSNGYEKKWFEVQNDKMAQREESYKWSTEDM